MIRQQSWYFTSDYRPFVRNSPVWSSGYQNDDNGGVSYNVQFGVIPDFQINRLNWFGLIIQQRKTGIENEGNKSFRGADEMVQWM
jgi:hypothetical protein